MPPAARSFLAPMLAPSQPFGLAAQWQLIQQNGTLMSIRWLSEGSYTSLTAYNGSPQQELSFLRHSLSDSLSVFSAVTKGCASLNDLEGASRSARGAADMPRKVKKTTIYIQILFDS